MNEALTWYCSPPTCSLLQVMAQLLSRTLHAAFVSWVDFAHRSAEKGTMLRLAAGKLRNATRAKVRPYRTRTLVQPGRTFKRILPGGGEEPMMVQSVAGSRCPMNHWRSLRCMKAQACKSMLCRLLQRCGTTLPAELLPRPTLGGRCSCCRTQLPPRCDIADRILASHLTASA